MRLKRAMERQMTTVPATFLHLRPQAGARAERRA